jgi:N-acyl-D-amino-acid deacylase
VTKPPVRAARSLLFRGVSLVDGTGSDARPADVLLAAGRVAAVASPGAIPRADAGRAVDGDGLVLAPGFIDAHSHADCAPLIDEVDVSKISQGVTTEVVGNCGFSLAPCPPEQRAAISQLCGRLFPPLAYDWVTVADLFEHADAGGYIVNAVPLVGHHAIRIAVMGTADRAPGPSDVERMRAEVSRALAAGAGGLSSGLIYPPGMYGDTDELAALASVLSSRHTYSTHLRGEGTRLLESVTEAVEVARRAGCRLQVSHLKAAGRGAWGSVVPAMKLMDSARQSGVRIHHDVYPYEANSTLLASCLPPWFHDGGHEATLARLHDPDALARAEREIEHDDGTWDNWVSGSGWDSILVTEAADSRDEGRTVADIARTRHRTPFQTLIDLLIVSDLRSWMCVFAMSPEDVEAAMLHPRGCIGSDGVPPGRQGKPHPRLFGTFTRVLARYVRETGRMSLPEAIAKMTSLPAEAFGLHGRGVVAVGAPADVVLFDPQRVADKATFTQPTRLSTGIEMVVVNGSVGFEHGRLVGVRSGRRLDPANQNTGKSENYGRELGRL